MAALNKVMVLGNVGNEPEVRQTQSGRAVANFSVATTDVWGDGEDRQERTEWHQVVVWGKLAETCGQYLTKGRQVLVEGRLQTRSYEDRDGHTRSVTEIVAQQVQFLGGRAGPGPADEAAAAAEPAAAREQAAGEAEYQRAWEARQAGREEGGDGREERERE